MSPSSTSTGTSPGHLLVWLRLLLHLTPSGGLFLGLAAAHYLSSRVGGAATYWLPLTLLCLVTIAAGLTDSILKWRSIKGAGAPPLSTLGMDTVLFGLSQILIIPAIGSVALLLSTLTN